MTAHNIYMCLELTGETRDPRQSDKSGSALNFFSDQFLVIHLSMAAVLAAEYAAEYALRRDSIAENGLLSTVAWHVG